MTSKRYKVEHKMRSLGRSSGKAILVLFALSSLFCKNADAQLYIKDECSIKWLEGTKINNAGKSFIYDGRSNRFKAARNKYAVRPTKKVTSEEVKTNKETCSGSGFCSEFCFKHAPSGNRTNFSSGSKNSDGCVNPTQHQKLYAVAAKRIDITVLRNCKPVCEAPAALNNCITYRSAKVTRPPPPYPTV
jgi:hypothetical protein